MPTQGLYYPSKVVQVPIDPTRTVSTPFNLDPTYALPSSQVWYLQASGTGAKIRVQDPLLFNSDPTIIWSTTAASVLAASFFGMIPVTVVSSGTNWPAGTPDTGILWVNTAFINGVTTAGAGTKILMGTNGPAEFVIVSESEAAVLAAANAAVLGSAAPTVIIVDPAGSNQANAAQVRISSAGSNYLVRSNALALAGEGIRIDMVDPSGALISPVVGTEVRVKHDSTGQAVLVYPGVGYKFENTAINTPIYLFSKMDMLLICYEPGIWNVSSTTTSELRTQLIQPIDQLDHLALGNGNSPGVMVTGSGATPADPMLCVATTDNGLGYDPEGLTLIGNGAVAAVAMGDNTFRVGGAGGGFEGKLVGRAYPVVAADIATEIAPALLIDITSSTGASPAIQFNGNKGSISYVANNALVSVGVKDVGGALIGLVIPAGSAAHYISFDEGGTWKQVSIF